MWSEAGSKKKRKRNEEVGLAKGRGSVSERSASLESKKERQVRGQRGKGAYPVWEEKGRVAEVESLAFLGQKNRFGEGGGIILREEYCWHGLFRIL